MQHKDQWVDLQIQEAMKRGDFDNLPGAGKPIEGLGTEHDPDWWLKKLVEREKISVLPPALQLRKDDAELDAKLDRHTAESEVRRELEEFNARVMRARYTPVDGPPLITMPRDVETEVDAWRDRRLAAGGSAAAATPPSRASAEARWFRRALSLLELRPSCECCDIDLPPDSPDARICTFECTFCAAASTRCSAASARTAAATSRRHPAAAELSPIRPRPPRGPASCG